LLPLWRRQEGFVVLENIIIRLEEPTDYDEVYQLVKTSFATARHCDGDEQDYLNEIRKKDTFIPELSLVAENDSNVIIGQIILHKTNITTPHGIITELVLGPVCVHPDYFRRGIARTLINEALRLAKAMGFKAVFLCGEPEIYEKLGFVPSYLYNIFHKNDKEKTAKWSMVYELYNGSLADITGIIDTI